MSNEAINWAFRQDVPMARKFVLIVLANYADESHSCFPGQKLIAARIGSSVETVRRALADLEAHGLIRRARRNRDSGHRSTDRYVLPVDEPTGQFEVAARAPEEAPKVADPTHTEPPTGQFAYKAESGSLPVNLRIPTPQSEGANEPSVKPKEKPKAAATPKIREDVQGLCVLLADRIEANGSLRPTIGKTWTEAARRMIDIDKREPDKAANLIRWSQANLFWRKNILSMVTFRDKYDQLRLAALEDWDKNKNATVTPDGEVNVDAILGRDVWSPGTPPEGLDVAGEIAWKKTQRAVHQAERLAEARKKLRGTA